MNQHSRIAWIAVLVGTLLLLPSTASAQSKHGIEGDLVSCRRECVDGREGHGQSHPHEHGCFGGLAQSRGFHPELGPERRRAQRGGGCG